MRKYRDIDIDAFELDIENSLYLPVHERSPETYNSKMRLLIEQHAPLQTKQITLRPNTEWYTSELRESNGERRKAERKMRKTGLTIHKQIYRENCISANRLLFKCKKDFYYNKLFDAGGNQKQPHRLTNNLMGNKHEIILPLHSDELELSNKSNQYFLGKIETIRNNLNLQNSTSHESVDFLRADTKFDGHPLALFTPASTVEVKTIIMKTAPKSCELDPIPTSLLKQCLDSMLLFIADIINDSLGESCVPPLFKEAIVRPLLKKTDLVKEMYKNYRSVANLPYLSKGLEKVVAARLEHHLDRNSLHDDVQSAYRSCHSTETGLLRVHHDMTVAPSSLCLTYRQLSIQLITIF